MPRLDLDDLRLFARVAELGTLSAAARERNVPVSQISRALQRLEAGYGVRLVHRSTHGLSLTDEGHTFHGYCTRVTATLEALDAEFARHAGAASGLVRISCSSVIAEYALVPGLAGLQQRHPRLAIDLQVDDRLVDMARDGVDIAIRTGKPASDTLVMRRLGQLRRRLYASPDYLQRHGRPRSADDLRGHRLLANSAHASLNQWVFGSGLDRRELIADGGLRTDNTGILAAMALGGLGIARIVTLVGEPLVAQGRLEPVLAEQIDETPVPLSAVMLAERHRLPKIQACIDYWAEWFAPRRP